MLGGMRMSNSIKVFVLDDSKVESELIRQDVLEALGPETEIHICHDTQSGQDQLKAGNFQLGIIDIRLKGDKRGTEFLKNCRKQNIPLPEKVLFVSNFADEETAMCAMNLCATLIPKTSDLVQSGESPLRLVLKKLFHPLRRYLESIFPGKSVYAQETRETLYLALTRPKSMLLILGSQGSGRQHLANHLTHAFKQTLQQEITSSRIDFAVHRKISSEDIKYLFNPSNLILLENVDSFPKEYLKLLDHHLADQSLNATVVITASSYQSALQIPKLQSRLTHRITLKPIEEPFPKTNHFNRLPGNR
jgi:DNA-binding NarL/FixJ family response regulator